MKRPFFNMERRHGLVGLLFISPFLVGFFQFFLFPAITSVRRSFSNVSFVDAREVLEPAGFANYAHVFFTDPEFLQLLIAYFQFLLPQLGIVLVFSMFIALTLEQKFLGRVFFRAIFFVPVIVSSGIVISILSDDLTNQAMQENTAIFITNNRILINLLIDARVGAPIIGAVLGVINSIFDLAWRSGVQILLFLAALVSIPKSFYEASTIEGASGWSTFWKITFPMISPFILVCVVYTIVDTFTDYSNPLINYIYETIQHLDYGYASAMAWVYTLAVFSVLGATVGLISRRVFYMVD